MNILKNNKGITLLALAITVLVLIIITGAAVSVSVNILGVTKFENVETALLLIQSKCKILAEKKAIGEIEEDGLYGVKQEGEGEFQGWYLLSMGDLIDMGVKGLNKLGMKESDESGSVKFYVDYALDDAEKEVDVAYIQIDGAGRERGVAIDDKEFKKLSEIKAYTGK